MTENSPTESAGPARAVRLIFEYDGDEVTLVSQHRVDVAVTGFDLPLARPPGHYVEVRNTDGDVLSGVPARNAFLRTAEVFPEKLGEPITRVDVEKPHGAFTVVVPVPEAADQVAVVRILPATEAAARGGAPVPSRPEDLATFPLDLAS